MTKREQYKLSFDKMNIPNWGVRYTCTQTQVTDDSIYLSQLLDLLSVRQADEFLYELNNALSGAYFEEYFSFNASSIDYSVRIMPPNVVINGTYSITLNNLKELVEEWVQFING
jgi:hypothetical protein